MFSLSKEEKSSSSPASAKSCADGLIGSSKILKESWPGCCFLGGDDLLEMGCRCSLEGETSLKRWFATGDSNELAFVGEGLVLLGLGDNTDLLYLVGEDMLN